MTALKSPLPSAPSSRTGNPPAGMSGSSVPAGADFSERARVILADDASNDTADRLDTALASGDREVARIEAEIDVAQRIAVDPLASADDAATAEARTVSLGLTLRRTRSAVGQLEARLTAYQRRVVEMRAETERRAALDRHAAAVEAIRARYPNVAEELATMFAELAGATEECQRLRIHHSSYDSATGSRLGVVGAMGTVGIVYLPRLDSGTHWPVMRTPDENRAISRMMGGSF